MIKELRREFLNGIGVPAQRPFVPDRFQVEAIESLKSGVDTLVIAPTGSGKTFIATQGILETVRGGRRAVYTAPLKALSNAKYAEFKRKFEPDYRVGLLTGDRKIEGDASIVVATTEIYRNELYAGAESYGLVVLDELHYLADPQRGPVWEESIILSPTSTTLLMLSASISNAREVADWIQDVRSREVRIITETRRPVELRMGFLHPELGVIPLEDEKGQPLAEVQRYYSEGPPDARSRDHRRGRRRRRRR